MHSDSSISHPDTRYRAGKLTTFAGYLVGLLFVTTVFRDQLGHLAVAVGITAAAVTLALQEVIASVADWVAIPFGHFYQVGNRVQLGGIMGDAIDIGILRTTVMECGDEVNADLHKGRILNAIDETHGRLAIASTTIHIVETPVLQVHTLADESYGHTPSRKG